MINLDELKLQFRTRDVVSIGECVIVPRYQWRQEWEEPLINQGCKVLRLKPDGDIFVRLPVKEEPPTLEPQRKHPSGMKGPQWSREDEDRLVKRANELDGSIDGIPVSLERKCRMLTKDKEFEGRSSAALVQKFNKLVKRGMVQPGKRGRPKKQLARAEEKDVCSDCGLPKDLCCCDEEKKESLRSEPCRPFQKEPERKGVESYSVSFEAYCRTCRKKTTAQDKAVWRVCPVCLEPLIIWDVREVSV